jgi:AraC-like DNA-binding protein
MHIDQLSALFARFNLRAGVFYNGNLCGIADFGAPGEGSGHLHLLKAGKLALHLPDGSVVQVTAPCVMCFPRPLAHRFSVERGEDAELTCASLHFDGAGGNPIAQAMPPMMLMHADQLQNAAPLLAWLFAESRHPAVGGMAVLNRLSELLVIQLVRHLILGGQVEGGLLAGLADTRLAQSLDAVHRQPETAWTVETMAAVAGMSRARFAAHFRATVGLPPLDYLTRWRIALAQQQLLSGRAMKLVANAVGYDSASALARTFRRQLGCSPAAWLQLQREADAGLSDPS